MIEVNDTAPDIALPAAGDKQFRLKDLNGPCIVFFYPKANTPGCTTEAKEFSAQKEELEKLGFTVVGISADPVTKLDKFAAKHDLTVELASDEELNVLNAYGVWVEKSMYGKKFMGIERSTFLIDASGIVRHVWRKVKVKNHVAEVLEVAKTL